MNFNNLINSKPLKIIVTLVLLLFFLSGALVIDFYAPTKRLVTVDGGDVKRVDEDGIISATNPADGPTRDVFFVYTTRENGKPFVYRNEDTGWGFPHYLKFNSADVQAKINTLKDSKTPAVIVSYGWRIQILSMFPNIVNIKSDDAMLWSIRRVLLFSVYILFWGWVTYRIVMFFKSINMKTE